VKSQGRIVVERDGSVAHIMLDNAARRNAISGHMWDALGAFCRKARHDTGLRAVIISGAGDHFSAGADISGFDDGRSGPAAKAYDDLVEFTVSQFEDIPQMVFAAISGACMGAGASLAVACDFRICEAGAFFAVPAASLGLGYDPRGIARFTRIFGETATKEAILLAARIPADRAHALGAVNRLAAAGEALSEAKEMAVRASLLAPLTQSAAKAAIREAGAALPPTDAVLRLAAAADASEDYAEGRAAFAGKRVPSFRGQ